MKNYYISIVIDMLSLILLFLLSPGKDLAGFTLRINFPNKTGVAIWLCSENCGPLFLQSTVMRLAKALQ